MLKEYLMLTFELTIGFIGLLISVRIIGRRQLAQVTPFDFVSAVTLGEIVGSVLYIEEANWLMMVYGIAVWTLLSYLMEIITIRYLNLRKVISGTPAVVISNGIIQYDVMKKEKIDFNELLGLLRRNNIFSIQEVQYAFIETSGDITILKKGQYDHPTREDLKLQHIQNILSLPIIIDGELLENNLTLLNITKEDVQKLLTKHGFDSAKQLMYAEYDNETFYYQEYQK